MRYPLLFCFLLFAIGCGDLTPEGQSRCGHERTDDFHVTLHAGDHFTHQFSAFPGECGAGWIVYVRWADPARRLRDTTLPPIDLSHVFKLDNSPTILPLSVPRFDRYTFAPWDRFYITQDSLWWEASGVSSLLSTALPESAVILINATAFSGATAADSVECYAALTYNQFK